MFDILTILISIFIGLVVSIVMAIIVVRIIHYLKSDSYKGIIKFSKRRKQKMTGNHLVSEVLLASVQLTDNDGVPKKGEGIEAVDLVPGLTAAIEDLQDYELPEFPGKVGTQFTVATSVESTMQYPVKIKVDPKIGDPVGEFFIEYNGDADTEATKANIIFGTRPKAA